MASTRHNKKKITEECGPEARENIARLMPAPLPTAEQITAVSPIQIANGDPDKQMRQWIEALFEANDKLYLAAGYKLPGSSRIDPIGKKTCKDAEVLTVDIAINRRKIFEGGLGAYMRTNPVKSEKGSGKKDAICDNDIARFEYGLIEHDALTKEQQLGLLSVLRLPIVSLVDSGGKSIHALVRVGAPSLEVYTETMRGLYTMLRSLGFDPMNSNPSRYTRVPGNYRIRDDGQFSMQRLIYLNPKATHEPIIDRLTKKSDLDTK